MSSLWVRPRWARTGAAVFIALGVLHLLNTSTEAGWALRIPEILKNLQVSLAVLGLALSGQPLGLMVTAPFSARLVTRFGPRAILRVGAALYWPPLLMLGLAPSWHFVFAAVFVSGIGNNLYDVAWGVLSTSFEQGKGRRHHVGVQVFTSAGLAIGTFTGGEAARNDVPILGHIATIAVIAVAVVMAVTALVLSDSPDQNERRREGSWRSLLRSPTLLGLAAISLAGGLVLGGVLNWSALLLEGLGEQPGLWGQSAGQVAFMVTSVIAQLAVWVVPNRLAPPAALTFVGGAGGLAGSLLLVMGGGFGSAVTAFALLGLGSALSWPLAQSVAAERFQHRRAQVMVVVITAMYAGIGARSAIGPISDWWTGSLASAMGITLAVASLVIAVLAPMAMRSETSGGLLQAAVGRSLRTLDSTELARIRAGAAPICDALETGDRSVIRRVLIVGCRVLDGAAAGELSRRDALREELRLTRPVAARLPTSVLRQEEARLLELHTLTMGGLGLDNPDWREHADQIAPVRAQLDLVWAVLEERRARGADADADSGSPPDSTEGLRLFNELNAGRREDSAR
jgi:MFS family permease